MAGGWRLIAERLGRSSAVPSRKRMDAHPLRAKWLREKAAAASGHPTREERANQPSAKSTPPGANHGR